MENRELVKEKDRVDFLKQIFENTKLEVTESYSYPAIKEDLSDVILYHIKEVTFEGEEKSPRREAFENVIGMIQNEGVNFIYLILGDKKGVSFYFGLIKESNYNYDLPMPIREMGNNFLKSAIRGNFRGSKIEEVNPEKMKEILEKIETNSENKSLPKKFANVMGTPGINETEDKKSFQGVDRLVDVMLGDEFGLCIIAKPISKKAITKIEDDLYYIHNELSSRSKYSLQDGENKSSSLSDTKGKNDSTTIGTNETNSTNNSETVGASETVGTNESNTKGTSETSGSSESSTKGTSETTGSTKSDTTGSTKTTGTTENKTLSSSETSGTSENKSSGVTKSTNENKSTNIGKSYSENDGIGINNNFNIKLEEEIKVKEEIKLKKEELKKEEIREDRKKEEKGKDVKGKIESTARGESSSFSVTKGNSSSTTTSTGLSNSESFNKSVGTNSSKSTSKSASTGINSSEGITNSVTSGSSTTSGTNESSTIGTNKTSGTNESSTTGTSTTVGTNKSNTIGSSVSKGVSENTTSGTSESNTETVSKGVSQNISRDIYDKKAADYVKYIDEILLPIIDYGKSKGLYLTTTFIFSDKKAQLEKLGNTMKSLYSGKKGNKNPLEFEILDENDKKIEYFKNFQIPECIVEGNKYIADGKILTLKSYLSQNNRVSLGNWYSPNELGLMASLPKKEVVGLALNEEVEFGLNAKTSDSNEEQISLGNLVQSGNEIDMEVSLEKSALNKHIFITGVTGTGKTTTCQKLLLESKLPFLVIEPAKTEYRILMNNKETEDILIFTLGKDDVAPFRLNPFEFFEGESITSRVDMLKAAMEASFDMEAAIPQIIESAMYSCYEDYGWNIDNNKNEKFSNPYDEGVYSFPTLEDLLNKVETEVTKHNFDDRLKKDYIGSITARLQGLLVGAKGQMLNTRRGIDFRELIEKKVVLEIEEIKNGTEKSLIMGFILTNLYEALKAKFKKDKHFKHITLIEEAHRLLSKYSPGDSLNKKNSVETFADMLAEVRKYGESLIIADQIPDKMTPEVLKNTNTKIVHKIFAEDDKEAIGNTISLSKEQKDFLSSLSTGRAIVFSQGWTKALQVQIKQRTNTTSDENIDEDRLKSRVEDFYIENYKKGIFIGTKYEKISKEDFEFCREFSTNKEAVKIFKEVFEENIDNFKNFKDIVKELVKLSKEKNFWEDIKQILVLKEKDVDLADLEDKYSKYYDIFNENLHKIIFNQFYNVKIENKKIVNDVKNGIEVVFNSGNFRLDTKEEAIKNFRGALKSNL